MTALEGLTILDFSRVLAGPYATMLLADFGARVVKVERPGAGDETRAWAPPVDSTGTSTYFASVNRNKEGITADLGDPRDRERLLELLRDADVVVENFRTGTMERLGLGYEELRAENPRLIYCSITGFGPAGGAALPGFDLLVQAVGGLMSITGQRADEPTKAGVAVVDVITGLHAVAGILTAVIARGQTGEGQRVEVNLLSSLLSGLVNQAGAYVGAGVVPGILGNAHPSIAPYEVFETADRPIAIAVGTDGQFRALAAALGLPGLADDERFTTNTSRVAHRGALGALITERLRQGSADAWFEGLTKSGVPAGPINTIAEAFSLAERLGLHPVVEVDGSPQVANPIALSRTPARYRLPPPPLGASRVDPHA
ncbi:CaiB/BaiF CoA transferase family protein [Naasia aerilata]|uniref:CoA transferase n=1 Tax=Naasia aerilata TaxID=1162966 RepID=A0ABN6XNR8_9MICO|nr:CoA transferase [Naasia aerilata]BDZ45275.1 CoA transferase [Naasia aerilata]